MGNASCLSASAMLHRAPPPVGTPPSAARNAFSMAASSLVSAPITSPVDFISGPSAMSIGCSLDIENTGALMATTGRGASNPDVHPSDLRLSPQLTRVASSTMGTPVTLLMKGTVREDRGFTSITCERSSLTTKCRLPRHGVTAVHAGPLHVLHESGYEHSLSIGDDIDVDFATKEILVDEHAATRRSRFTR